MDWGELRLGRVETAYVEVLQQTTAAVPPPVDAFGEVRSLLEEDGRGRARALWREGEDVDWDFLRECQLPAVKTELELTAFCAANTQFISPT
jgi:hypothetical protein